jgi:outer membrane cobalamin receptor
VLIDGIKVNDPTNTRGSSFDFSTLNIDHIERIEIVRGSLSAVYGSDAISGVINIVTQEGSKQPTADVRVSGG